MTIAEQRENELLEEQNDLYQVDRFPVTELVTLAEAIREVNTWKDRG